MAGHEPLLGRRRPGCRASASRGEGRPRRPATRQRRDDRGPDGRRLLGHRHRRLQCRRTTRSRTSAPATTADTGSPGSSLSGVRFLHNVATDNGEPGIYIGDSPDAQAVVIGNTAIRNGVGGEGFGFLLRDSSHGLVIGNRRAELRRVRLHRSGFNQAEPLSDWTARGNTANRNNGACPRTPAFSAFSGTGILLGGTHAVTVDEEPRLRQPAAHRLGALGRHRGRVDDLDRRSPATDVDPTDNVVARNVAFHTQAGGHRLGPATGSGNRFRRNHCAFSIPFIGSATDRAAPCRLERGLQDLRVRAAPPWRRPGPGRRASRPPRRFGAPRRREGDEPRIRVLRVLRAARGRARARRCRSCRPPGRPGRRRPCRSPRARRRASCRGPGAATRREDGAVADDLVGAHDPRCRIDAAVGDSGAGRRHLHRGGEHALLADRGGADRERVLEVFGELARLGRPAGAGSS